MSGIEYLDQSPPKSIAQAIGMSPSLAALATPGDDVKVQCHGLPIKDAHDRITGREECNEVITLGTNHRKFAGGSLCCDACCKRYDHNERVKYCKAEWDRWLRDNAAQYQHFSTDDNQFNRPAYEIMRKVDVSESVILFGPSGTCKTYMMLLHLKRALWHGRGPIKVLWGDQLKRLTSQRYVGRDIEPYENAGVLGIEELFAEDAAKESYTSFVRNLIDLRLRTGRPTIITMQLSSKDLPAEVDKYENARQSDRERLNAIMRRISEKFKPIPTDRNHDHETAQGLF